MSKKVTVQIVVAMNERGFIGKDGDLMYRCREDLQHFKEVTKDTVLIMGRKTFESLPGILPGRPHFVVTSDPSKVKEPKNRAAATVNFFESFGDALNMAKNIQRPDEKGVSIIGGESIYKAALPFCTKAYVTRIDDLEEGDASFPMWDLFEGFEFDPENCEEWKTAEGHMATMCLYEPIKPADHVDFIEDESDSDSSIGDREATITRADGVVSFPCGLKLREHSVIGFEPLSQRPVIRIHLDNSKVEVRLDKSLMKEALETLTKIISTPTITVSA